MSTSVIYPAQPERILKGLSQVWTQLGEEEKQQGKPTVLRACAMTLVVATDEADGGFLAEQTLIELMHEHPSRAVVLRLVPKAERSPEARVLAQCWKPFGKAQQICCEQIEITANHVHWPKIGPTMVGITVADLPTVVWCRQSGGLDPNASEAEKVGLNAVLSLATKVIVDSQNRDVGGALKVMDGWRHAGRIVGDLQWTRLTPWRETLANSFDHPERLRNVFRFRQAEIAYTDEQPSTDTLYMAGWLISTLGLEVKLLREDGFARGLHRVSLLADGETIELVRTSCDCLSLRSEGREQMHSVREAGLYSLMNEELRILSSDRAFDRAFAPALEISKQ